MTYVVYKKALSNSEREELNIFCSDYSRYYNKHVQQISMDLFVHETVSAEDTVFIFADRNMLLDEILYLQKDNYYTIGPKTRYFKNQIEDNNIKIFDNKLDSHNIVDNDIPWHKDQGIVITPVINGKCSNNCSFCDQNNNKNNQRFYTTESIIHKYSLVEQEKIKKIVFNHPNVFDHFDPKELFEIEDRLYSVKKFNEIKIWTTAKKIVQHRNVISTFSPSYKINWQIGFESFSESQLLRYNKKENITYAKRSLELIDGFPPNHMFSPLMLVFDPWLDNTELYETYKFYLKNVLRLSRRISCTIFGYHWTGFPHRIWIPRYKTKLFEKAISENLILLDRYDQIWSTQDQKPWEFKNKDMSAKYDKLLSWSVFIKQVQKVCKENKRNSCLFCPGITNSKLKHKHEFFIELNEYLLEYVKHNDGIEQKYADIIDEKLSHFSERLLSKIESLSNQ